MRVLTQREPDLDIPGITAAQFLAGGLPLIPLLVFAGGSTDWSRPALDAQLIYLIRGGQVLVYLGFNAALARWPSTRVYAWTFLVPAVAVVIEAVRGTLPGVSEINAWGGQTKQFQVVVDPALLDEYGLTLHDVTSRIAENNTNFGGGYIEHAAEQYTLLGTGRALDPADLGNIVLTAKAGTPVLLRDIGTVQIGPAPPEGLNRAAVRGQAPQRHFELCKRHSIQDQTSHPGGTGRWRRRCGDHGRSPPGSASRPRPDAAAPERRPGWRW